MLTRGVSLLHDNARCHTAPVSQELLTSFGWDIVTHLPYSPDLAPSDYHFFTKLKEFLGGKRFYNNQEVEEVAERAGGGGL
jgi:histone-lysine N-methyltransferase SETMAR